jgi:phytanoyl-CoA hydroxylase
MSNKKDYFKKNGYLLIKDFFSKDEIKKILDDAKGVFLRQFIEKKYISNCTLQELSDEIFNDLLFRLYNDDIICLINSGKQIQHLVSLHSLSIKNIVLELCKNNGVKTPVISTRPVLYFNHPKLAKKKIYHTVNAHQDWRSMQGSINSVVIWVPLVNINKDLGALEILPGSHLSGLRTVSIENGFGMVDLTSEEEANLISIEIEAGDALLFSSFLIHRSGINITNEPRWSCHFRYNDLDDITFINRKYAHPYIYQPMEDLITKDFPSKEQIFKFFSL